MPQTVLVFGSTGAIGSSLIETIVKEQPEWEVRAVSRSGKSDNSSRIHDLPNVKLVKGDIEDRNRVLELANQDVNIVYCCVGFTQYERKYWAKHWPVVIENLLAASRANPEQKHVFCDNLYAYGPGRDITTSSAPVAASTKSKPAIRSLLRKSLAAYMQDHPTRMTVVGAADFFGPDVTAKSFLGDSVTGNLCKGKRPMAIGSADVIHDFCYAPDFVRAMYVASISAEAYGQFWIAPHTIRGKTMRQIAEDIAKKVGSKQTIQVLPSYMVSLIGTFVAILAELKEMMPFWKMDYTVSGGEQFTKEFGVQPTPYDDAIQSTVNFYQNM